MNGPYPLAKAAIVTYVPDKFPGVYMLSSGIQKGEFLGESQELQQRLLWWANMKKDYNFFWFEVTDSIQSAFNLECHLFHNLTTLKSDTHPSRPDDTLWQCLECDIYKVTT